MVLCSVLNAMYVQPRPQAFPLENGRGGVTVIWASPSHITLAIWVRVRVRVTGDAHITRVLGMGMPIITVTAPSYLLLEKPWMRG